MLKVPIYRLENAAPKQLGWILLENGQLACEPKEEVALKNILQCSARAGDLRFYAKQDPEGWLKALPTTYYGSYFWAGDVQQS